MLMSIFIYLHLLRLRLRLRLVETRLFPLSNTHVDFLLTHTLQIDQLFILEHRNIRAIGSRHHQETNAPRHRTIDARCPSVQQQQDECGA